MRIIAIILLGFFIIPLLPLMIFLPEDLQDKLRWRFRNTWLVQLVGLLVFIIIIETSIEKSTQGNMNSSKVKNKEIRSPLNAEDFSKQRMPRKIRLIFQEPSDYNSRFRR